MLPRFRHTSRIAAAVFILVSAMVGCGGGDKHYSRDETRACLAKGASVSTDVGFAPRGSGGDLNVQRAGHEIYLAFGANAGEAKRIADGVAKLAQSFGAPNDSATTATAGNVAYWSNGNGLTAVDRQFVTGCLGGNGGSKVSKTGQSGSGGHATGTTTATATTYPATALDEAGLRSVVASFAQPVFWAGPEGGYSYELRRTSKGNVYVRYLPAGVKAGAPGARYLVVATYPFVGASQALKVYAQGKQFSIPSGGIAVVATKDPRSVYLAFPGVRYQVEVYDPSAAQARAFARSGRVAPVR